MAENTETSLIFYEARAYTFAYLWTPQFIHTKNRQIERSRKILYSA